MPHTINGIGTWYHGKLNVRTRPNTCESCGRFGQLASYDTTEYFVVLFIPLIPLKKVHVISECPSCRRHRAAKLKDWHESRTRDVGGAAKAYLASPRDPALAAAVIGAACGYDDESGFLAVSETIERELAGDAKVMRMAGVAYEFFGYGEAASAAMRKSLEIEPDAQTQRSLAASLIKQGKPTEAEPLLEPIIKGKTADGISWLALLVEGYQAAGMHEQAISLLDRTFAAFPDLAPQADWQRLRKLSEKHRASGKPIKSEHVASVKNKEATGFGAKFAAFIGPAIAVLAILIYLLTASIIGMSRTVHLTNGTLKAYDVSVNGKKHTLAPMSHQAISVSEGTLTVTYLTPGMDPTPQTTTIATNFWTRPFTSPTYILNPDRQAIIVWEETEYAKNPSNYYQHRASVGKLLHEYSGVDYVFKDFPATVSVKGNSAVKRSRLGQTVCTSVGETFNTVAHECGEGEVKGFVLRQALLDPEDTQMVMLAAGMATPAEFEAMAKPQLESRPVRISWHRAYQETKRGKELASLEAEYRKLLDATPADTSLMYLLGRVVKQRSQQTALFEKAARGNPPVAYAFYALAFDKQCAGEFEEALRLVREAKRLDPSLIEFRSAEYEMLLALKRYDEALSLRQADIKTDGGRTANKVSIFAAQGKRAEAMSVLDQYLKSLGPDTKPAEINELRAYLSSYVRYFDADRAGYVEDLKATGNEAYKPYISIVEGRFAEAVAAFKDENDDEHGMRFFFAALLQKGDPAAAKQQLDLALKALAEGDRYEREAAALFERESPPSEQELNELTVPPQMKVRILAAMPVRFPATREMCFRLARKLNYGITFPVREYGELLRE